MQEDGLGLLEKEFWVDFGSILATCWELNNDNAKIYLVQFLESLVGSKGLGLECGVVVD